MLSGIVHNLTGYVCVKISGDDKARLINLAVKSGLRFWRYRREEDCYYICVKTGDFKRLRYIKRRCRVKIAICSKNGLPFKLMPYRKRLGLVLGAVFAVCLIFAMSGRVWVLTTSGSQLYTESQIMEAAKEAGIYLGAEYKNFDATAASNTIMRVLGSTDWVSVNTDGVNVDIAIKDSEAKPFIYPNDGMIQNVVAKRTGVVKSVEAQEGWVSVKIGEGVREGQMLISGIWESYDKWGEKTGFTFTGPARGIVMAETQRNFSVSVPMNTTVYEKGRVENKKYLTFFGISIPVTFPVIDSGSYKKEVNENFLWIMDTKMPMSLIVEKYTEQIPKNITLTEDEAKARLDKLLEEQQKEILGDKGQVLSENREYQVVDGHMRLTTQSSCLENIAEEVAVLFN